MIINLSKNVLKINNKIYKKYNLNNLLELKQFNNEFKIIKLLNKKNIIGIPKLILKRKKNNNGYLIFEYIQGKLLSDIIQELYNKNEAYDYEKIDIWIKKIKKILNNIHKLNILHRDLKPDNIIINDKKVYLIDFGNSIIGNFDNNVSGTINYMCPKSLKLFLGYKNIKCNYKSDLWSFCIIIYELIYHHNPFIDKFNEDNYKQYQNKIINNILIFEKKDISKILYKKNHYDIILKKLFENYYD